VAVVQYTFTRKKLGTYITIKNLQLIWEVRAVPCLCELYPGICLTSEEKNGKTSVMVAARTSQADTAQYKNNEQYSTLNKNSNTE
jgi:hypothetical protein